MADVEPIRWLPTDFTIPRSKHPGIYTYLFKIASRCNLNCDYCYVYRSPDQSWKTRPKFMSLETVEQASRRIAIHAASHGMPSVSIVFHGGEPLLVGPVRLSSYIETLRSIVDCKVEFAVQTNGTLLSAPLLDLFARFDVKIGISIDGDRATNNRHRPFRNGRGSYDSVMNALTLISQKPEWEELLGGFLAVINLQNNPVDVFSELKRIGARSFDLLLPDSHHDAPPARPQGDETKTAYGEWLSVFFDVWVANNQDVEIRFFEEIMAMLFGEDSSTEAIGAKNVDLIVIETDGDIEAVDTLKVVSREATSLGMNVRTNDIDDVYQKPAIASRLIGYQPLCKKCTSCEFLNCCGGGYLPHRYGNGRGFLNESVYCEDIIHLIKHIRGRLTEHMAIC